MPHRSERLRVDLERYLADGERDERFRQRMLTLLADEPRCFARDAFVPGHFTASTFVLSPAGDALLLILHAKLGLWLQPGGHVEPDDADLLAAARRELAEEVGLSDVEPALAGIFDVDIHEIPANKRDPAHQHFDVRYLLRARASALHAASDARAARWTPLARIAEAGSDDSVIRAVRRLQRRSAAAQAEPPD